MNEIYILKNNPSTTATSGHQIHYKENKYIKLLVSHLAFGTVKSNLSERNKNSSWIKCCKHRRRIAVTNTRGRYKPILKWAWCLEWGEIWRGSILLRATDLAATFAHAQFALFWTNEEVHHCHGNPMVHLNRKAMLTIRIHFKQ